MPPARPHHLPTWSEGGKILKRVLQPRNGRFFFCTSMYFSTKIEMAEELRVYEELGELKVDKIARRIAQGRAG